MLTELLTIGFLWLRPRVIEQMAIAAFGHPFGPLEVRLPTSAGASRFGVRVAVEDDAGYLAPVGTFCVGVKEAQVGDEMLFIIRRDGVCPWRFVRNVWIKFRHRVTSSFWGYECRRRNSSGAMPVCLRKAVEKFPKFSNPRSRAISVIGARVLSNLVCAWRISEARA